MSGSDRSSSDDAGVNTRCSPKRIAQVVGDFCPMKKKLVAEIKFKGMLQIPEISKLDKKFTLSLLDKIDIKRRAIKLSENSYIDISAQDVHHYIDIPNGPNKLFGLEDSSPSEKMDFIRFGIGSSSFDIDEKNSLKAAEEILTKEYPNEMTQFQADQFKVSFVCFCMGNFLVAKYSSNHGAKDYWGSLMNPSEIESYDFCQAVVDELMEAARHVQREKKANRAVKNVSGCHLFLQAKFLDSINLGILNIEAGPTPRIAAFTFPILQEMKIYLRQNSKTIKSKQTVSAPIIKGVDASFTPVNMVTEVNMHDLAIKSGKTPTGALGKAGPGIGAQQGFSFGTKGKETPSNICSYVNTIKSPGSTAYLAAYSKDGFEKRLNEKQVDDLRLHNARMRLLINTFKSSTLACMDCSETSMVPCKEVFNSNVNKLMEDILDQVLVLSKRLHDHSSMYTSASFIPPSLDGSGKRSFENSTSSYEGAPIKREKKRSFFNRVNQITGKNLIHDLTGDDSPPRDKEINDSMLTLDPGFVTPQTKSTTTISNELSNAMTSIGSELIIFPNMVITGQSEINQSSSALTEFMFKTPKPMAMLSDASPVGRGHYTDSDLFDDAIQETGDTEFNKINSDNDVITSPIIKVQLNKDRMAKNPWFFGVARQVVDKGVGEKFKNWLAVTTHHSLDSWWIIHHSPSPKRIAGNDFKSVFTRGLNFTGDLMDVAIRRFGQTDRNMYGTNEKLRWMHSFETDFARKVLNGDEYLNSRSIRHQLTANSQEYDISNCRMLAVPHISKETWSVYLWDMKEKIVHVVDPTFDYSKACELQELHSPIVDKLQGAIQVCFANSFVGWEIDWSSWKKNYVQTFLIGKPSTQSALLTLLAMRKFNGSRFEIAQTEDSLSGFSMELLYDMLSLEGNSGTLPEVYAQSIE